MTEHRVPQERDLPAGRLIQMKEELMAQIQDDIETGPPTAGPVARRPWRRLGLAAAILVAVLGVAGALVLAGDDAATANTAVRNDDGSIAITLRDAQNPEALQQRLEDLGVPAVVDFLESGFGCDPARSTGWVEDPPGEELFGHAPNADDAGDSSGWILHPDELQPGQTVVLEFQVDEHEGSFAAMGSARVSTGPVGPCEPVPNDSVVDAEAGIAGG